ncbi:MAG: hypothetical protein CMJ89_02985 [Planctomycetes bacterium]|jgi:squalene-hopene/tetraprenyl-beta-curcumene cyclase|nr:hypothetical protein [Planctomycetota bacterium]
MKSSIAFAVTSVLAGYATGDLHAQVECADKGEQAAPQQARGARPDTNRADELRSTQWSLERAEDFALRVSTQWSQQRQCITCHTNGLGLAALAGSDDERYTELRSFAQGYLKRYVIDKESPKGSRGAVEGLVMTTAMLTISDMETTGDLTPVTRAGLRWCMEAISPSGAFEDWMQCGWPPFEVDEHFGVAVIALALGHAPARDRRTTTVRRGTKRLLAWMRKNEPINLHQKGMRLWAGNHLDGVLTTKERRRWIDDLLAVQREDGGVALRDLGENWRRADGSELEDSSDAYATAFTLHTLREAGVPSSRPELMKMGAWLKREQRESGRWFSRSPHHDGKHFISHAATLLAIMALRGDSG